MATRQKKVIISGISREQAEEAFGTYAKAEAESEKIKAEIELQCARLRERHSARLSELDSQKEEAFNVLHSFAVEHQQELFSKKKSLDMTHGVIGFRTGTPKLKTLKGFTWASALQLVKEFLPGYIRQTEEIAKDKLLADRDTSLSTPSGSIHMAEGMMRCGIGVVQDETFYVEAKEE